MDVLIRNVNKNLIRVINQYARDRRMSQQEFLLTYLRQLENSYIPMNENNKLELLISDLTKGVSLSRQSMKRLEDGFERLSTVLMIASDVEE